MDEVTLALYVTLGAAILAWIGWITYRIETISESAGSADERMSTLEDALGSALGFIMEQVKGIGEIKDYLPQFTIQTNPLQGIFDAVLKNWGMPGSNAPSPPSRDENGQFAELIEDGTQEKEQT